MDAVFIILRAGHTGRDRESERERAMRLPWRFQYLGNRSCEAAVRISLRVDDRVGRSSGLPRRARAVDDSRAVVVNDIIREVRIVMIQLRNDIPWPPRNLGIEDAFVCNTTNVLVDQDLIRVCVYDDPSVDILPFWAV